MDQEKHSVSRNLWYWNGRVFFKKNIFTYGLAAFLLVAVPVVLVVVMQLSYQGHRIVKLNEQTSYQNRSITKLNEQISHQDQRIAKLNEQISYQDQRITVLIERMENCTSVQDETISHSLKTEVHDLHSGFVTETLEKVEQRIQQLNQSLSQVLSQSDESLLKLQLSATSVHAQFQGEIEELHRLYQTLQTNLSSVSASEDALAQKIKRMKNIFGNCQTTVDTCDIGSTGNSRYWKACPTHFFQKEKQGYLTLVERCSYKSEHMEYSETLTLFERNGQVRCDCDVTFPGEDSTEHRPVEENLNAQCIITIVRCPL